MKGRFPAPSLDFEAWESAFLVPKDAGPAASETLGNAEVSFLTLYLFLRWVIRCRAYEGPEGQPGPPKAGLSDLPSLSFWDPLEASGQQDLSCSKAISYSLWMESFAACWQRVIAVMRDRMNVALQNMSVCEHHRHKHLYINNTMAFWHQACIKSFNFFENYFEYHLSCFYYV
jgi:hypothetical protein